jgi:PAS domain S-box-containing protein
MAPEQALGQMDLIDHRTDVYGLGAVLYHVLTGNPPFADPNVEEVLRKVQTQPPIPPRQVWSEVPEILEAACLRALSKAPSARFCSAADLAREVEQWQEVQRLQAEQALRDSETLFRSLVDVLPLSLVRKNLDSRFTFANRRFCEAVGKPLAEIIGKTDFDYFPANMAEDYRRHDRQVFETRAAFASEEKFIEQGKIRDIEVIKTPTYDSRGELTGLQIIVWDVTDRKQLQADLRQKTTEVERLQAELRALRSSP